jgi:hypothetical protein
MHGVRYDVAAETWRLLCLLFLRLNAVPADPSGARRGGRRGSLLSRVGKRSAFNAESAAQRLIPIVTTPSARFLTIHPKSKEFIDTLSFRIAASRSSDFVKNFGCLPCMNFSSQSRHRRRSSSAFSESSWRLSMPPAPRVRLPGSWKIPTIHANSRFIWGMSAQTASLGHDALHACNHPCAGPLAFKDTIFAVAAPPLRAAAL